MTRKSSIREHIEKNIDLYKKQNIEYYSKLSDSLVKGIIFRLENPNLKVLDNYLLCRRREHTQNLFSKFIDKNMYLIENFFVNDILVKRVATVFTLYLIIFIMPLILIQTFYYYFIRLFVVVHHGLRNKKTSGIRSMLKKLRNNSSIID